MPPSTQICHPHVQRGFPGCKGWGVHAHALEGRVRKLMPVPLHELELSDSPAHWNVLGVLSRPVLSFPQPL